jgi:hypothetical protein
MAKTKTGTKKTTKPAAPKGGKGGKKAGGKSC